MVTSKTANLIWRDNATQFVSSSGKHKPVKADIRAWGSNLESVINTGMLADAAWKSTVADLNSDLDHAADTIGVVYADTTSSNNGLYLKSGASGTGSWAQLTTFLPGYQFVTATDDTTSTANAYSMDTSPTLPSGDGVALVCFAAPATNTNATVTVSFDGGTAKTILTASGNSPAIGGIVSGMLIMGVVIGSNFYMRSDQSGAAIQAAAEAAQAAAEAAAASVPNFVATRAAMAADIDPTTETVVSLTEAGRAGLFRAVPLVSVTGLVAADTEQGMFVPSTNNASYVWQRVGVTFHDLSHFGWVTDGTIDVNDRAQTDEYANAAAVEAATIGGSVEAIFVAGEWFRRYDDDHPMRQVNRLTNGTMAADSDWTKGTGWTIGSGVATGAAGTASALSQTPSGKYAIVDGETYMVRADVTVSAGSVTPTLGSGGSGHSAVSATGTIFQIITAGSGGLVAFSKSSTFAGTLDNLEVRKLPSDAIQSADGAWWAGTDVVRSPVGTGAVTGTDNMAALQGVVALQALTKLPIVMPDGDARIVLPEASQTVFCETGPSFIMYSNGAARVIMDDPNTYGGSSGQTGNVLYGPARRFDGGTYYDRNIDQLFSVAGITHQSTWWRDIEKGGRTWTTSGEPYRCHVFAPENYEMVIIERCSMVDIMGFGVLGTTNGYMEMTRNWGNRITGNFLRAEDSSANISYNRGLHIDDDWITATDLDDRPNDLGPRVSGVRVIGNEGECAEGMLFYGSMDLIVQGNTHRRIYGTGIAVYATNTDTSLRGEGGLAHVRVFGNQVMDQTKAASQSDPPDDTFSASQPYPFLFIGGKAQALTTTDPVGEGSATPVADSVFSQVDYPWGPLWLQDAAGSDGAPDESSGYRGFGVEGDIKYQRTLPEVDRYSDWGFGRLFDRWGFFNPPVTIDDFAARACYVGGAWDGLTLNVDRIVIGNVEDGIGVYLSETTTDLAYKNVAINIRGSITHCFAGVSCDAGSAKYQDIKVCGGIIDCDPERQSTSRAAGNKWSSATASTPTGIHLSHLSGCTFENVLLKNCANMWTCEGGAIENPTETTIKGLVGIVDFGSAGTSTTHADNRGIGRIPVCSEQVTYQIRDLDPASGTFDQATEGMRKTGGARPSSGKYVRGHLHHSGDILDIRKTTGSSHGAGTDWASV